MSDDDPQEVMVYVTTGPPLNDQWLCALCHKPMKLTDAPEWVQQWAAHAYIDAAEQVCMHRECAQAHKVARRLTR